MKGCDMDDDEDLEFSPWDDWEYVALWGAIILVVTLLAMDAILF